MKRYLILALTIWAMTFDLVALAAAPATTEPRPSWFEHADLMTILISGLISLVLFFMVRTLRKVDKNQTKLYTWIEQLSKDFYRLEGSHNTRISMGVQCGGSGQSAGENKG